MSRPGWDQYRSILTESDALNPDFFRFLLSIKAAADAAQPTLTAQPVPAVLPTDGTATADDLAAAINTLSDALIAMGLGSR